MTVYVDSEAAVMREAAEILLRNLAPSKLARFWASWQVGQGDYLRWRDEVFGHYTVSELYDEVLAFQTTSDNDAATPDNEP